MYNSLPKSTGWKKMMEWTLQDVKRVYELSFLSILNFLFGQDLSIENITNSQNDSKIFTHLSEFKMSKNKKLSFNKVWITQV